MTTHEVALLVAGVAVVSYAFGWFDGRWWARRQIAKLARSYVKKWYPLGVPDEAVTDMDVMAQVLDGLANSIDRGMKPPKRTEKTG